MSHESIRNTRMLPLVGRFGPMPYTKRIYQLCDSKTKATLKLVNKVFWSIHAKEKFFNNYSPGQTGIIPQLYCCSEACKNTKEFASCFEPKIKIHLNGEIWSNLEYTEHGWPKMNKDGEWSNKNRSKMIQKWRGCKDCWAKFTTNRPEYGLNAM